MNTIRQMQMQRAGSRQQQGDDLAEFSRMWSPQAAEAKVRELLASGQMSREQFDALGEQARRMMGGVK